MSMDLLYTQSAVVTGESGDLPSSSLQVTMPPSTAYAFTTLSIEHVEIYPISGGGVRPDMWHTAYCGISKYLTGLPSAPATEHDVGRGTPYGVVPCMGGDDNVLEIEFRYGGIFVGTGGEAYFSLNIFYWH